MIKAADLPDTIPLFPLSGALLLPRARLPLHVFEPRYLQMLEDVMATRHRLLGLVQPREVPGTGEEKYQAIGCAGRLTGFSETEDGRYMITLTGVSRFRLGAVAKDEHPYLTGQVDWTSFVRDLGAVEGDAGFDRATFLVLLQRYFQAMDLSTDWSSLNDADEELMINSLSMLCPFPPEDKQALLEAPSLTTRRETLVTLIEFALRGGTEGERLQ